MPRARDVVMKQLDAGELHSSALRRAIKLHSPYEVVAKELVGIEGEGYAIVYTAPLGGDRMIAATRAKRSAAVKLRDLLADAWARGKWSAGRE